MFHRFGLATAALVAALMAGCGGPPENRGNGPPPEPVTPVTVATAERGTITETATLVGSTRFVERTLLKSEARGRILELNVREGEHFAEGDLLVRLDDSDYQVRLVQEQAALAKAQRLLDELRAGTRQEVVDRLQAAIRQAESDLRLAKDQHARTKKLFDEQVKTEAELIRDEAAMEAAEAALAQAKASHLEALNGPRAVEIKVAEAEVEVARAQVASAEHEIAKCRIRAPYAGVVLALHVDMGNYAEAGNDLMTVARQGRIEAIFGIPERYVRYVRNGQVVPLQADAFPGVPFEGEVVAYIPEADPQSRNFRVRVMLTDPEGRLAAGMFVRATVAVRSREDAILVPQDAVVLKEGDMLVFTVEGEESMTVQSVPVKTGLATVGQVEILEPELAPGTRVVTTGGEVLFPGAKVMIARPGGGPSGAPPAGPPASAMTDSPAEQ